MLAEIANKAEVRREAAVMQHAVGVAAHREDLAGFDVVVLVEDEAVGRIADAAVIDHRLTVVFAGRLQVVQLEQPIGGGVEAGIAQFGGQLGVGDGDRPVFHQTRVGKAVALGQVMEVVPVQRAAQAFAVEQLIFAQRGRQAAVGIDVGEVQLAAFLQQAIGLAQHAVLVRREVDHAVGDDHVEAGIAQAQGIEVFDIALAKLDIGKAELLGVVLQMGVGHRQLLDGHVHANHLALAAHQLRQQVAVTP